MLRLHLSLLLLLKIRTELDIIPAFEHFRTLARASVCIVTQSGELLTKGDWAEPCFGSRILNYEGIEKV